MFRIGPIHIDHPVFETGLDLEGEGGSRKLGSLQHIFRQPLHFLVHGVNLFEDDFGLKLNNIAASFRFRFRF